MNKLILALPIAMLTIPISSFAYSNINAATDITKTFIKNGVSILETGKSGFDAIRTCINVTAIDMCASQVVAAVQTLPATARSFINIYNDGKEVIIKCMDDDACLISKNAFNSSQAFIIGLDSISKSGNQSQDTFEYGTAKIKFTKEAESSVENINDASLGLCSNGTVVAENQYCQDNNTLTSPSVYVRESDVKPK